MHLILGFLAFFEFTCTRHICLTRLPYLVDLFSKITLQKFLKDAIYVVVIRYFIIFRWRKLFCNRILKEVRYGDKSCWMLLVLIFFRFWKRKKINNLQRINRYFRLQSNKDLSIDWEKKCWFQSKNKKRPSILKREISCLRKDFILKRFRQ